MLTWFPQFNPKPHPFRKLCSSNEPHDPEISPCHKDTHPSLQGDVGEGGEGEGGGGERGGRVGGGGGGRVGEGDCPRLLCSRSSSVVKKRKET